MSSVLYGGHRGSTFVLQLLNELIVDCRVLSITDYLPRKGYNGCRMGMVHKFYTTATK